MESAKAMLVKEQSRFISDQKQLAATVIRSETQKVMKIPQGIIPLKMRKEFMDFRSSMYQRSYYTQCRKKSVSEWTLPKMMRKAKEEERLEVER